MTTASETNSPLSSDVLKKAAEIFKSGYDSIHGGFGGAPKFPQPGIPSLVLRAGKRFGTKKPSKWF